MDSVDIAFVRLTELNLGRHLGIHQRCAAIGINSLSGNPACLLGTEERNDIADIGWSTEAAHGSPSGLVPLADEFLDGLGQ